MTPAAGPDAGTAHGGAEGPGMNPRRLLRNSLFLSVGVVLGGLLLFATLVILARYLSVARFGEFAVAITLSAIFQHFADGGLANVTVRDLARSPRERPGLFGSTLLLAWVVSLLLSVVVLLGISWWNPEPALRATALAMAGAALLGLHASLQTAVIRAHDDMGIVALVGLGHKLVLLLCVVVAVVGDAGIEGVALAHLAANALQWLVLVGLVRRRYLKASLRLDLRHWRYLAAAAVPLGAGMVLRRMTTHAGTFLLAGLAGAVAVGLYNAAFRLVQMAEIGTVAVTGALLPAFSRLARHDRPLLQRLLGDSCRLMLVLAGAVGGLLAAFGPAMAPWIFGRDFAAAGPPLQLLGLALILLMPSAVLHTMFQAIDRQTVFLKLALLGVATTTTLGLVLISRLGATGAAVAALATEVLLFAAGVAYLRREGWALPGARALAWVLGIVGLLCAVAWGVRPWVSGAPSLVAAILLFVLAYGGLVLACRVVTPDELRYIASALRQTRPRPPGHA